MKKTAIRLAYLILFFTCLPAISNAKIKPNPTINISTGDDYSEYDIDLTQLVGIKSPVSLAELNSTLIKFNTELKKQNRPLIYFGVSNKKTPIIAPFFPYESHHTPPEMSIEELNLFYTNSAFKNTDNFKYIKKELDKFTNTELVQKNAELLQKNLLKSTGNGAVVLSKIYYAFIKKNNNTTAKVKWYSQLDYTVKGTYFENNPIDFEKIEAHIKSLSSSNLSPNDKIITAWFNYLTDKPIYSPKENIDNTAICKNILNTEVEQQAKALKTAIEKNNNRLAIISILNASCSSVLKKLPYETIVKAITTLSNEILTEQEQDHIHRLITAIPPNKCAPFLTHLKSNENKLMNTLTDQLNQSKWIDQLIDLGSPEKGDFLKKERIYLYENFVNTQQNTIRSQYSNTDATIKILTHLLDKSETDFEKHLTKNNYQKLIEIVNQTINQNHINQLSSSFGTFFAATNNQNVYIDLLTKSFFGNFDSKETDFTSSNDVLFVINLFQKLPVKKDAIYNFISQPDQLTHILTKSSESKYQEFIPSLYKILDEKQDVQSRINIYKWAIDNDAMVGSFHEYIISRLFLNITSKEDKLEIHKFLMKDDLKYFIKGTSKSKSVVSLKTYLTEFITDYTAIISEVGTIEDRLELINYALSIKEYDLLFAEQEKMVSHLFDNINQGQDFNEIFKALTKDDYKLFTKIWIVLKEANSFEWFNTDNEYANNFIEQITNIMSKIIGEATLPKLYTQYSIASNDYLNDNPNNLPKINIVQDKFIPFAIPDGIFRPFVGNNKNTYAFQSTIITENNTSRVKVSLIISQDNANNSGVIKKQIINTQELKPFDYVYIEFIEDTTIAQKKYPKGTIKVLPAMYIAMLDNLTDADRNSMLASVMLDVVSIAGAIPTGGASFTLMKAAEIAFTTGSIISTIYKKELEESDAGKAFLKTSEVSNLLFSIATSPNIPKSIIMVTPLGEVGDAAKQVYSTTQNFQSIIKSIPDFGKYKVVFNNDILKASLQSIKNKSIKEYNELFKKAQNLYEDQSFLVETVPSATRVFAKKILDQTSVILKTFKVLNTETRYGKEAINQLKGFSDNIDGILKKEGITLAYFKEIQQKSFDQLNASEKVLINRIRNTIPLPTSETVLHKVLPPGEIDKFLKEGRNTIGGFFTTAADSKHAYGYLDIVKSMRLDYDNTQHFLVYNYYGSIRYKVSNTESIHIPKSVENGGSETAKAPFTGSGFTGGNEGRLGVPELKSAYLEPKEGAELWKVYTDGTSEELLAIYSSKEKKFIPIE